MATFPIISNGHFNFRRWYLLFFISATILFLVIFPKIFSRQQTSLFIGFFILLYLAVYFLFVNHRESFEIHADRIETRENGRLTHRFGKNNLAAVRFRLLHPSVFMTQKVRRYYTQHFIQYVDKQEIYEFEVRERDMQSIIKHLQSFNYKLTDLAEAMDYFQEDPFYKYAIKIIGTIGLLLGVVILGAYWYF
ncbi:MAG: hypothetical protein AAB467_01780 [Patescibacteria group bacterium]